MVFTRVHWSPLESSGVQSTPPVYSSDQSPYGLQSTPVMTDISRLGCGESPLESTGVHMEYGGDRQELQLTCKGILWNFTDAAWKSFQALKSAFTSTPVLTHWVPDKPIIVETDASDYALGAILSVQTNSGEIHPMAFHSHTFSDLELNYDTHDKELLAIFEPLHVW